MKSARSTSAHGNYFGMTSRRHATGEWVRFAVSVLVSLAVGLATWLLSDDKLNALLMALITQILGMIVEMRFVAMADSQRLQKMLYESGFKENLLGLSSNYLELMESSHPLFVDKAAQVIMECVEDIRRLKEGSMKVSTKDVVTSAVTLMENVKKTLFATSLVRLEDFWFRGFAEKYLRKSREAVARGVDITRVFLVSSTNDLKDPKLRKLVQDHLDMKVDTRVVDLAVIPEEYIQDFGLWDDELAYFLHFNAEFSLAGAEICTDRANLAFAKKIKHFLVQEARDAVLVLADISPEKL